jgi:hypothetical protein
MRILEIGVNDMSETPKYDNVYWRKIRREKEIPLRGDLNKYVGCTYNLINMYERSKAPMAEDKIERYIAFIKAHPEAPPEINEN